MFGSGPEAILCMLGQTLSPLECCAGEAIHAAGVGFGDVRVNSGKSGRGCNKGKNVAQGKPSTRSWKSPVKSFPKKMVPKGFKESFGQRRSAPVGRPRKAGNRCVLCKQFGHIATICPSKYINLSPLPIENDYLVDGTCGGSFDSIWVVDPNFKTHMTGNRCVFKRFKRHFGVMTDDVRREFSFVHGIGEVKIPVDGKVKIIPCVSYVPRLKRNVVSLEQVLFQGIETTTTGDSCILKKMFGGQAKGFDVFENKSEIELEEEYLDKFYDGLNVDNGHRNDKEKFKEYVEDFYKKEFELEREKNKKLNGEGTSGVKKTEIVYSKRQKAGFVFYYENLKINPQQSKQELRQKRVARSQEEEDVIEGDMIIESCLEALDLILLHEELVGYEKLYSGPFEEVLMWFILFFLGIFKENVMPPTFIDGRDVSLILLHRIVTIKGGVKKVIEDDIWAEVAVEYGFEADDAYVIKFMKKKGDKNAAIAGEGSKKDERAEAVEKEDEAELVITIEVASSDDD
ncbi:putative transcription factor interactor and regulator CCHC(Zn) family [Helianthus anomalus]